MAEARLEQARRDEELKLRTLALIAEQERRKLESQRIVLIAEAQATEVNIIADAASELAEEKMSQTADMAPLLSTNEKVSAFLSVHNSDHEDITNVSRLPPDCLATQIHSGLVPSPVVAGTSRYSKPSVSVQGPAFSMASSIQANYQVAYSTVPASQVYGTSRYSKPPVSVQGPAFTIVSSVQANHQVAYSTVSACQMYGTSRYSKPPMSVQGPAFSMTSSIQANYQVAYSTVPASQAYGTLRYSEPPMSIHGPAVAIPP